MSAIIPATGMAGAGIPYAATDDGEHTTAAVAVAHTSAVATTDPSLAALHAAAEARHVHEEMRLKEASEEAVKGTSKLLREAANGIHKILVPLPLHKALKNKTIDLKVYQQYIVDTGLVHAALEKCIANHPEQKLLEPLRTPLLARAAGFQEDIEAFECSELAPSPAAEIYANYLPTLEPHLLLAHGFVAYLALLHGGQKHLQYVNEMISDRWEGIGSTKGLTFTQNNHRIVGAFCQAIDALDLGASLASLCDETPIAWKLSGAITAAVLGDHKGATDPSQVQMNFDSWYAENSTASKK